MTESTKAMMKWPLIIAAVLIVARVVLEQLGEKLIRESEKLLGGDLINSSIEIIDHE